MSGFACQDLHARICLSGLLCLETDRGEAFLNLEQICTTIANADSVQVEMNDGRKHTFTNSAAHVLDAGPAA